MSRFPTVRVFAFGALIFLLTLHPAGAQQEKEWTWKDSQGKNRTRAHLDSILKEHRAWARYESGTRADLSGAHLNGADLSGAGLENADLEDAELRYAHLENADLFGADLTGAYLSGADLAGAHLRSADLTRALMKIANLTQADLKGAHLVDADLTAAVLSYAHLSGADLTGADLSGADLTGADLTKARVGDLYLAGAIFEPDSLPELKEIARAKNLELLTYSENPNALVQLRKQFLDTGYREQEREITYALRRKETEQSRRGCKSRWNGGQTRAVLWSSDSNLANCGSFLLNQVFFDWTCQYGMSPGRPLSLGVLVWALCSLLYFVCVHAPGKTGLYRVYAPSLQESSSISQRVEEILPDEMKAHGARRFLEFIRREWLALRASMFFSLMSAFNIGFRDCAEFGGRVTCTALVWC